jgi:V/A-type H+-transporting ATPase subunit K
MYIILVLAILIVVSTITAGIVIRFRELAIGSKKVKSLIKYNLSAFVPVIAAAIIFLVPQVAHAETASTGSSASGLGFIAAALSTGLATIGTGYAVGSVGSSALGAVSEDPKILGKTLIFVGLAEGIAIYGLIVSIMILGRL